jgi:hypothetical protein
MNIFQIMFTVLKTDEHILCLLVFHVTDEHKQVPDIAPLCSSVTWQTDDRKRQGTRAAFHLFSLLTWQPTNISRIKNHMCYFFIFPLSHFSPSLSALAARLPSPHTKDAVCPRTPLPPPHEFVALVRVTPLPRPERPRLGAPTAPARTAPTWCLHCLGSVRASTTPTRRHHRPHARTAPASALVPQHCHQKSEVNPPFPPARIVFV